MNIEDKKVVSFHYTLTNDDGETLDTSRERGEPMLYLHGANNIIPGLENALSGKQAGDTVDVSVAPQEAYGERDDAKQQSVPRDMFPQDTDIEPGMQFHAQGPGGETLVVTVAKVEDDSITVDGNHPLAGVPLNFAVEVIEVREASQEEISHGHVHGPGGHQHA